MPLSTDFLVQFEEDRWEPGRWRNLSSYPGHLNSVILQLAPFVNYRFRVIAINSVGQSEPSLPSPQYKTSGAGEIQLVCLTVISSQPNETCPTTNRAYRFKSAMNVWLQRCSGTKIVCVETAPDVIPRGLRGWGSMKGNMEITWEVRIG